MQLPAWTSGDGREPSHWYDGTAISGDTAPPLLQDQWNTPAGCAPAYETGIKAKCARTFTDPGATGAAYRPLVDQMRQALRPPDSAEPLDPRLVADGGSRFVVFPAFFEMLQALGSADTRATVVIRTFGSDLVGTRMPTTHTMRISLITLLHTAQSS